MPRLNLVTRLYAEVEPRQNLAYVNVYGVFYKDS